MKRPNGHMAVVDLRKLEDYCLDPSHLRGRNKARVFAAIGLRRSDADELRAILLNAAATEDCRTGEYTPYGERLILDFDLFRNGQSVTIRSAWIVRTGKEQPRLTSCYVL